MNIEPREWDLQERALREDAAWREVAQALRRSPGEPPAEFAASVAATAGGGRAGAPVRPAEGEAGIERWILRALAAVLVLASIGALARYGGDWLGSVAVAFEALVPAMGGPTAANWAIAAGACMALSWAIARGARLPAAGAR